MGTIDIIILAVVGLLTVIGLWSGMVKQIFSLLGIIGGFMAAVKFYQPCSAFLIDLHPGAAKAVCFAAIFISCILAAHFIGWMMGRFVAATKLGFLNRIGGGILGFMKGCIVVSIGAMVLGVFLSADHSLLKNSSTIKYIEPVTTTLKKVTRENIVVKYGEKTGTEKPAPMKKKK